jgi:hypothetical protein
MIPSYNGKAQRLTVGCIRISNYTLNEWIASRDKYVSLSRGICLLEMEIQVPNLVVYFHMKHTAY